MHAGGYRGEKKLLGRDRANLKGCVFVVMIALHDSFTAQCLVDYGLAICCEASIILCPKCGVMNEFRRHI